jgi:RNA polymerase subunit RPABC4/transcription elongation factor Spt4
MFNKYFYKEYDIKNNMVVDIFDRQDFVKIQYLVIKYWELICLVKKEKQKIEEISQCPKCGSKNLSKDYSRAELICKDCGLVIDEELIDHGPEWRAFDSEQREKRARTGLVVGDSS